MVDYKTPEETRIVLSLQNVTNTSDANKPVSTAQAEAIAVKADIAALTAETGARVAALGLKADKTEITGVVTVATTVSSGTSYSVTGPTGIDAEGKYILFTPTVTNTATAPTIAVNGGAARLIIANSGALVGAGRLVAGVPVVLRRSGGDFRTLQDFNPRVARAVNVAGTGSAYTCDIGTQALGANDTIILFKPHAMSLAGATIAINGLAAVPLYDEQGQPLKIRAMDPEGRYLLHYTGLSATVTGCDGVDTSADRLLLAKEVARFQSMENSPLDGSGKTKDPIYVNSANGYPAWSASAADFGNLIVLAGTVEVDLRSLPIAGEPWRFYAATGTVAKFITDDGLFVNSGKTVCSVYRLATDEYHFDCSLGAVAATTGLPAVKDLHVNFTGQSLAVNMFNQGLSGLHRGLFDFGGIKPTLWVSNGATGSTGLVPASSGAGKHWWEPSNGTPGPMALAWKANLQAAFDAGQTKPDVIVEVFRQADAGFMGTDATLTIANYKIHSEALIAWQRQAIADIWSTAFENIPYIMCPLGVQDKTNITADKGTTAVRWVQHQIVTAGTAIYMGPAYYDLSREFNDVHLTTSGSTMLAYRLGLWINNVLNGGTASQGPAVVQVSEFVSGQDYRLRVTSGTTYTKPSAMPMVAVFAAGQDPLSATPLTVENVTWETWAGGAYEGFRVRLSAPSAGATLVFPYGWGDSVRGGQYVRDETESPLAVGWQNYLPIQPFKVTAS